MNPHWEFVWAAYIVTWLTLLGYLGSLWWRGRSTASAIHPSSSRQEGSPSNLEG